MPKPETYTLAGLLANWQAYLVYIGTFVVLVGVWYQHHNLFDYAENINRKVFWANALWMLIQSFIPYVSAWMADFPDSQTPMTLKGIIPDIATGILQREITSKMDKIMI